MTDTQGTITVYPMLSAIADLMAEGRLEEAAQGVIAHLRRHPNELRGLALLGQIAMQLGALVQAEHFLRRALLGDQGNLEVKRNLASVLNQQERLDEACAMFEALEEESEDASLPAVRALILNKLGRYDEALTLQEQLTRTHPDKTHHWISYGHSLRAAGRVDEAISAYRAAIAADFECGEAWWGLASIKRPVFIDDDIVEMRRALSIAIDVRNSAPLHFALARALQDHKQHTDAFFHYTEANRQRAESIGYDSRELTAEVAEIRHSLDAAFMASLNRVPVGDATPVFIVSLPRSGSTLLEQMLGSHPRIEPVGELPYIPAILRSAIEMATRGRRITVPQLVAGVTAAQAEAMGRDYLRRVELHRKTERPYFIDKLPHNWSNILFIRRILPQVRFIDIRRAPMDCCFSNFIQSFSSAHASSFALKDIAQCYVDYTHFMDHIDSVAPTLVHHVCYERLIENPEREIKATLDYLELSWDSSVLDFHTLDRVVRTPSSEQVRRPLNRDGVGAWRPYAQWLAPLREALGPLAE